MPKRKPAGRGRTKGSRNGVPWFRAGRGWYAKDNGVQIKLCDEDGNHLKDPKAKEAAKTAYARHLLAKRTEGSAEASNSPNSISVAHLCQLYLNACQRESAAETYRLRSNYLFDFCTGFPARFKDKPEEAKPEDRIHSGFGRKRAVEITGLDVEKWISAHPTWKTPRPPLQALRRAFNYAKEKGILTHNPLRGAFKVPESGKRVTYFTPDVEEALYKHANPALAMAIQVMICTGARPLIELGSVTAADVEVDGERMCWRFPPERTKTRREERIVRIPSSIQPLVQEQMKKYPEGPIFRDENGEPWTAHPKKMKNDFDTVRRKLMKLRLPITKAEVPYTCRHTFAKRMLGGYWSGKPVTIEVLAGLMGDTREVCWEHYARWCPQYTDPLWEAIN